MEGYDYNLCKKVLHGESQTETGQGTYFMQRVWGGLTKSNTVWQCEAIYLLFSGISNVSFPHTFPLLSYLVLAKNTR